MGVEGLLGVLGVSTLDLLLLDLSSEGLFGEEVVDDLESTESLLKDTKLEMMLSCRLGAILLCWERRPWSKACRAEDEGTCLGCSCQGKRGLKVCTSPSCPPLPDRTVQGRKQMSAEMPPQCRPVSPNYSTENPQ